MRNRQMIVRWLMANTKAIDVRERDGKTYYVMVDAKAFQEGVGRLLAEVQRIKAEGDYAAADKLFETYGVHFDAQLRDEVVARVERLKMPSYTGFVQPRLEAVTGADGKITDVKISYPLDLDDADAGVFGPEEVGGVRRGLRARSRWSLARALSARGRAAGRRAAAGHGTSRLPILAIEDARAPPRTTSSPARGAPDRHP